MSGSSPFAKTETLACEVIRLTTTVTGKYKCGRQHKYIGHRIYHPYICHTQQPYEPRVHPACAVSGAGPLLMSQFAQNALAFIC